MNFTRESIFVGSIRSFCTSLAAILGILVGIILIIMGISFAMGSASFLPPKAEMTISADADGYRDLLPAGTPAVLRLNVHGVIGMGDMTAGNMKSLLLDSREDMLKNDRVKAVLLHIDSPGGTVTDADAIYRSLMAYKQKYKVPVYAYIDGLCASGGMYIASVCDKIYASDASVIGSVGVILGPSFNFSKAMETYGVQSLTITQGKDKDMLNPFRPWVPGEDQSLRNITKSLYDRFVGIVTTARPNIGKENLVNVYGAQVFVASEAQKLGYIDVAAADYSNALRDLVKAANISEEADYQVVELSTPRSFISELAQGKFSFFKGKFTHELQIGNQLPSELHNKFLYFYQP